MNALLSARRSPEVRSFIRWLSRQAIDSESLGVFIFPPQENVPDPAFADLTCDAASLVNEPPLDFDKEVHR